MVGILIVTHGNFGKEILKSAEMIAGEQVNAFSVSFMPGETTDNLKEKIIQTLKELKSCGEIMVFVDLFCGSPFNCVMCCIKDFKFQCLSGLNLPMLLEALLNRESVNVAQLKDICKHAYNEGLKDVISICKC